MLADTRRDMKVDFGQKRRLAAPSLRARKFAADVFGLIPAFGTKNLEMSIAEPLLG